MPLIESPAHSVEWATPPELFARLDARWHFTLDVCARANNAKCRRFFSLPAPEAEAPVPGDGELACGIDGLTQPWAPEVCWMNPPYGREIGAWLAKARVEALAGAVVVALIPARTDTAWWHQYVASPEGRVLRLGYGIDDLGQVLRIVSERLETEIVFLRQRVRFVPDAVCAGAVHVGADARSAAPRGSPTFPSAIVAWRRPGAARRGP